MARSPTEALTLTNEDREAVDILEKYIDESPEMKNYDGAECEIRIPSNIHEKCLANRRAIRFRELVARYNKVGWEHIDLCTEDDGCFIDLKPRKSFPCGEGKD